MKLRPIEITQGDIDWYEENKRYAAFLGVEYLRKLVEGIRGGGGEDIDLWRSFIRQDPDLNNIGLAEWDMQHQEIYAKVLKLRKEGCNIPNWSLAHSVSVQKWVAEYVIAEKRKPVIKKGLNDE
jgi:hypothetical protein